MKREKKEHCLRSIFLGIDWTFQVDRIGNQSFIQCKQKNTVYWLTDEHHWVVKKFLINLICCRNFVANGAAALIKYLL